MQLLDVFSVFAVKLLIVRKFFYKNEFCRTMPFMDRTDRKILAVLQANARASLQEIGQAVGLSASPCWGRIKKMEEAGVIEAHLVSGDYDYLLRVVVKDTRDYERLLREKLYKIKGIRHSRSSFVLRTLKKADLPLSAY